MARGGDRGRSLVKGSTILQVERDALWEVLDAPDRLERLLPHVRDFELLDQDGSFRAVIEPRISLGPVPVDTTWRRSRRRPANELSFEVSGRSNENLVDLIVGLELDAREAGTAVEWECEVFATGMLSSVGQRALAAVVGQQVRLVLAAAEKQARGTSSP